MMFYVYRDEDGYWRWRLVTASNQVLAQSPRAYHQKDDCRAVIQLVRNCGIARVHEIPVQMPLEQVPGNQVVKASL
ncbi:YegP family protein [Planctellipticum variicoloris]|uniref:YegP family protein n=1 Tax=Planctellipticum variicoloris TaxID=3064265 RepID=UPI002BA1098F|nr:DUF1508 domain-containing protein [Planctomycetaceae bacterium SH412]HTN02602.1 DUF1508 domain-containing protein [Planctomycetaceae bacterium]